MASRFELLHHPLAGADFRGVLNYFKAIDEDLAELFVDDFKCALRAVAGGRPQGTLYAPGTQIRWIKLKRFSHKVYFSTESDQTRFILAVISGKRHPTTIKRALFKRGRPT